MTEQIVVKKFPFVKHITLILNNRKETVPGDTKRKIVLAVPKTHRGKRIPIKYCCFFNGDLHEQLGVKALMLERTVCQPSLLENDQPIDPVQQLVDNNRNNDNTNNHKIERAACNFSQVCLINQKKRQVKPKIAIQGNE